MAMQYCEDMTYAVNVHLTRNGESYNFDAQISFAHDPDTYGNGFYMGIKSKEEAFGLQSYDIRYDKDFNKDFPIEYIVSFYSRRFDGKETEYDTKWKLSGIHVYEADFSVMDD